MTLAPTTATKRPPRHDGIAGRPPTLSKNNSQLTVRLAVVNQDRSLRPDKAGYWVGHLLEVFVRSVRSLGGGKNGGGGGGITDVLQKALAHRNDAQPVQLAHPSSSCVYRQRLR
ncbi:hypothetical protein MRX96_019504 [Rhipicephalus microplus]